MLDLRNILHLKPVESKLKLEIDYGDDPFKLKFKLAHEVRTWCQLLEKWKDFFVDYAHIHPEMVGGSVHNKHEKNEFEATNPLVQGRSIFLYVLYVCTECIYVQYMYVCMYVCKYNFLHVIRMYVCVYVCMNIYINKTLSLCMYVCIVG